MLSNMGGRKLNFRWLCIHKFPSCSHWGPFHRNTFVRAEGLDRFSTSNVRPRSLSTNHFTFSRSMPVIWKVCIKYFVFLNFDWLKTDSFVLLIEAMFPVLESAEMHCRVQLGNFGENSSWTHFYHSAPLRAQRVEILILHFCEKFSLKWLPVPILGKIYLHQIHACKTEVKIVTDDVFR